MYSFSFHIIVVFYPVEDSQLWYYSLEDVPANWVSPSFPHSGWMGLTGCLSVPNQPHISHFVTYFEGELELASYEIVVQYENDIRIYINGNIVYSDVPASLTSHTIIRSGHEIRSGINSVAVELFSSMFICLHLIGYVIPDEFGCVEMITSSITSSESNPGAVNDYDYLSDLSSTDDVQFDFFFQNMYNFWYSIYH